jgi:hypothetical protein
VEGSLIAADILARLPDQARQKLLLIDGLSDEALDIAQGAQARLNDLARRYPGAEENPSVPRLGAVIADAEHRRSELFDLVTACQRWVKAVPEGVELDVVAAEPPSGEGEAAPEEAVVRLRTKIGELAIERLRVQHLPEPKAIIKQAFRAEVARLAADARPWLNLERGRAGPVFHDRQADFGLSPRFVAGLLCWLFPDAMSERLDAELDQEVAAAAAMATDEQERELSRLEAEIEALGRQEEALIEAAFARGVDILRRGRADPACVLGVRARLAAPVSRHVRQPRPILGLSDRQLDAAVAAAE